MSCHTHCNEKVCGRFLLVDGRMTLACLFNRCGPNSGSTCWNEVIYPDWRQSHVVLLAAGERRIAGHSLTDHVVESAGSTWGKSGQLTKLNAKRATVMRIDKPGRDLKDPDKKDPGKKDHPTPRQHIKHLVNFITPLQEKHQLWMNYCLLPNAAVPF